MQPSTLKSKADDKSRSSTKRSKPTLKQLRLLTALTDESKARIKKNRRSRRKHSSKRKRTSAKLPEFETKKDIEEVKTEPTRMPSKKSAYEQPVQQPSSAKKCSQTASGIFSATHTPVSAAPNVQSNALPMEPKVVIDSTPVPEKSSSSSKKSNKDNENVTFKKSVNNGSNWTDPFYNHPNRKRRFIQEMFTILTLQMTVCLIVECVFYFK